MFNPIKTQSIMKKKEMKELQKQFPYIPSCELEYEVNSSTYKTERGLMKHLAKVNDECRGKAEQPDVKRIEMTVEWRKSSMWGYNPHLRGYVQFEDGRWESNTDISCGGCGYDKLSTVMADFLNRHLRGMLWRRRNYRTNKPPYGITYQKGWFPHFDGGVGENCTISGLMWLGFKLVSSSHGKTFDTYELVRK
jgi:hypothetical protein